MSQAPAAVSPDGRNVVEIAAASKAFGETRALRACSFTARAGEVHAVVGENGSGKSTLAKLLAGVLKPDSGSVAVNGEPPGSPRAAWAKGIAVVFQEILIAEGASVLDNLYLGHDGLFVARLGWRGKRERAAELMNRLAGAPVALDQRIEELPLAVRQWVVIGRALLGGPRLVVFDESTAALDRSSVERFFAVVRRLRSSGVCVLIVTHRIHELTAISDRATVLSDGRDVGTLEGAGITEARLLALMRGTLMRGTREAEPWVKAVPAQAAAAGQASRALMVSKLRLAPEAAPIDLAVACGEIVGLAGLEGQGQVEFIQAVSGIRRAHAGEVTVQRDGQRLGIDSAACAERARVAYIPGDRKVEGVFANLSVFENFGIACWRRTARAGLIDRRRVHGMFRTCVEKQSIRIGRESAPINSLSGGNQQKVVVGRALATEPMVLALNDPTRGVDIGAKRDLYALLRDLAAGGKAILFLSNEIEEFVGLCDRVVVFRLESAFRTLEGGDVTADRVLAAMFGSSDLEGPVHGGA